MKYTLEHDNGDIDWFMTFALVFFVAYASTGTAFIVWSLLYNVTGDVELTP